MQTKLLLSTFIFLLTSFFCTAQIPRGFNYQAVVRDSEGAIMADTELDIRFTIYHTLNLANPTDDYRETHSAMSNATGLVNVVIGLGTPDLGTWTGLYWINYSGFVDYYLKVEMDFGNGWLEVSDENFRSVPYAELADQAVSLIEGAWSPLGNYDTDTESCVGTLDEDPLVFKTDGSERMRIDENGRTTFTVSTEEPSVIIHNASDDSFEAILSFSSTFSADQVQIISNPLSFEILTPGDALTLNNGAVDFTLNGSGNTILKAANANTEVRFIVRDGTDTDIADDASGFVTIGETFDLNVCMDNNEIMARNDGGESELHLQAQGGGVVINSFSSTTHELYVNGVASKPGGGDWTASSDSRLKENVQPFTQGLDEVMKVEPVTYHYISQTGHDVSVEHVGVIAQDLQKISPSMVDEFEMELTDGTKGNYLSVDPSAFTYMLINSIKEQQQQIEELKKQNALLSSRLEVLEAGR